MDSKPQDTLKLWGRKPHVAMSLQTGSRKKQPQQKYTTETITVISLNITDPHTVDINPIQKLINNS